jgi:2-polyprenyl-3-methyl-5-hydroxy-6-metoxy-1,4-benzoquinol methylase
MVSDRETLAIYAAKADDYAALTDAHNAENPQLADFVARLPAGGRILDWGCGTGASAQVMADLGYDVDATDATPEMVTLARARTGVTAWQADFDALDATSEYDGIWASFCLLHAPRPALGRHLAACHRALRPGGQIYVAMKIGTETARDGLGRLYTYVTVDELHGLLQEAGFTVVQTDKGSAPGLDGVDAPWVAVYAHG